jgi:teichuronic acid biosynthesis glycosyltransferase TuaH
MPINDFNSTTHQASVSEDYLYIKNRDIVLFGFQPWEAALGSNFKDMALELAKHNRVLFVNRALDYSYYRKNKKDPIVEATFKKIQKKENEVEKIADNLWVHHPATMLTSINRIPFHWLHDWLNQRNNKKLAATINQAIHQLQFTNIIFINDNDFIRGFYLDKWITCNTYIFYIRDFMLGVPFFKAHGPRHEAGIIKKANLVVANSIYLCEYAKKINPNTFYIGQGCDLSQFSFQTKHAKPVDMPSSLFHPIIGYLGNISTIRIDAEVIEYIAAELPLCSIVLVGPVDDDFPVAHLKKYKNIYFLGVKSSNELAAYIQHFDVCINPQKLNEVTLGNYPRKIDEYLAMGKPVVAAATPTMELFKDHTWLCHTKEDYLNDIVDILQDAMSLNTIAEKNNRAAFALTHSWQNCIGMLGNAYHDVVKNADEKI